MAASGSVYDCLRQCELWFIFLQYMAAFGSIYDVTSSPGTSGHLVMQIICHVIAWNIWSPCYANEMPRHRSRCYAPADAPHLGQSMMSLIMSLCKLKMPGANAPGAIVMLMRCPIVRAGVAQPLVTPFILRILHAHRYTRLLLKKGLRCGHPSTVIRCNVWLPPAAYMTAFGSLNCYTM